MACTFLTLPSEVLDLIASHIETRSDVLHFGSANKRFYDVVCVRHLGYREVGPVGLAKEHDSQVWSDLVEHPDRTCNVRRLNARFSIMLRRANERQMLVNRAVQAIGHMRNLVDLTIEDCDFSLKPVTVAYSDISSLLQQYCSLKVLRLVLIPGYNFFAGEHFQRITSLVTLEVTAGPISLHQELYLVRMAASNVALQRLSLILRGSRVDTRLFNMLSLPNLRSFNIKARELEGDDRHLDMFLQKHPNLVEIDLSCRPNDNYEHLDGVDSVNFTLPLLEVLSGHPSFVQHVLLGSTDPLNNVACIKGIDLCKMPDEALRKIDENKIRMLSVDQVGALENLYRFRALQWLRVRGDEVIYDADVKFYRVLSAAEWAAMFAHLSRLQVLRGVNFIGDPDELNDVQDRAVPLCSLAPRLEFIDHWSDPELAIRLVRLTDGAVKLDLVSSSFADSFVDLYDS